jgi:NAD(P)-dependent dehydrogenase (short-subunit alcohol dehydrogenase family)
MRYTLSWVVALVAVYYYTRSLALILAILLSLASLWVLLVGGFAAMHEVLSAHTQPSLPPSPPLPAGSRMLVVGAARGLGLECASLARGAGWEVEGADASFTGEGHLDLTQPATIAAFCERLAARGVRHLDALLLVAGVCDAGPVGVAGSPLPRMLWVNFLGHVVVLRELAARNIGVRRIVLVSSGSYTRGGCGASTPSPPPPFFPSHWTPLGAMGAYAQSKFLVTTWAHSLRRDDQTTPHVVIINPGPMGTAIGDAHVPLPLWPTYGLMKEVLFPPPSSAATSVLFWTQASGVPPEYVDIRAISKLNAAVKSKGALQQVHAALVAAGLEGLVEGESK